MAAVRGARPSGRTSPAPGPPGPRAPPPSRGLHLPVPGLAARNPAPPEPRLLLVTVGCPSERRAPPPPAPGGIFHSGGGWGRGEGRGYRGGGGRGRGGGWRASGRARVPELRPEGASPRSPGSRRGRSGGGRLALSVTAPRGPILPGRRCPWMRPPRAPRPVSVPAPPPAPAPAAAPAPPFAAASTVPGARARRFHTGGGSGAPRSLRPGRRQRAWDGEPGAARAARSGSLRLVGSPCLSVELFSGWRSVGCLRGRGSPRSSRRASVTRVEVGGGQTPEVVG